MRGVTYEKSYALEEVTDLRHALGGATHWKERTGRSYALGGITIGRSYTLEGIMHLGRVIALREVTDLYLGGVTPRRSHTWEDLYLGGVAHWEELRTYTWEELHLGGVTRCKKLRHLGKVTSGESYALQGATHWKELRTGRSYTLGQVTYWEELRTYT